MITTTNETLRDDVLVELDADPRVRATTIGVTAEDGVVTISGPVSGLPEK